MLKPQDIVVLLKVYNWKDQPWSYSQLANSLGMSASEVHASLKRCEASGLYLSSSRHIRKQPLLEFLTHGLKYVFYTQPGALMRGIPTAHSAEPLKSLLAAHPEEVYVWPDAQGTIRGQSIEPLYRSVPVAVGGDPDLYAQLSLIDAIRVGRTRDRRLAEGELEKRLTAR